LLPIYCSELTERHSLVRGEESHEKRSLEGLNGAGSVDVEVGPGLIEVGSEVRLESITAETLVGGEDLTSEALGGGLIEGEGASGLADLGIIIASLTFLGIVGENGSHEKIIRASLESSGESSFVAIDLLARLPRLVDTAKGDILLVIGVRLRFRVLLLSGGGLVKLDHSELVEGGLGRGGEAEKGKNSDGSHIYYYNLRSAPI